LGGCASKNANLDMNTLEKEAQTTLGCGEDSNFYIVPSQGGINDAIVGGLSSVAGPSNLAKELAEYLSIGENKPFCIAVTGSSIDKTAKSILDALEINKGKQLTKLKFMYIGTSEKEVAIRKAVESLGAEFYFKSIE
jgi:hypothetical protein